MMEWIVSTATRRGDRSTNQDQLLVVDGALAVLDGATSWLPQEPGRDGGWYARMLAASLARRLPGGPAELAETLESAIAEVAKTYDLDNDCPYSTATLVQWTADTVHALVLGDSPVAVRRIDGSIDLLADDRLEPVGADLRERYREHLRMGFGFDDELVAIIAEVQRIERHHRNRPGGFWIAGADPNAAKQALGRTWPASEVVALAAMTDGVAAGVREYGLFGWSSLFDLAATAGVESVVRAVHEAELDDADGQRWPRTKRHDDKAIVVMTAVGR